MSTQSLVSNNIQRFIERANETHGGKYDYSLWVSYGGTSQDYHAKNIPILCPVHGPFLSSLANHLRGSGCPKCSNLDRIQKTRKPKQYYINKAKAIHGATYDYSLWEEANNTSIDKVTIICNIHGPFQQTPADHINSKAGCPNCRIAKTKETNKKKYGGHPNRRHLSDTAMLQLQNKEWLHEQHIIQQKSMPQIAEECNVSASMVTTYCHKHNIGIRRTKVSTGERQIRDFLKSCSVEFECNNRSIIGTELDIYLPKRNLAIEYNGLYWHSELHKPTRYHVDKTNACESKGIRLLQIFEDEWMNQQQQCKETILHLLGKSQSGCYGRNTTIKEIPWKEAKEFLNKYHLLGAGTSGNYRIGAYDSNNNLIAVMVFGQQNNEHSSCEVVELRRFVTDKRNNPGVGSKLFKWAVKSKQYNEIIAFVDRRWFTGLVKQHIGFDVVGCTPPAIWWTDGHHRYHRRFETKKTLLSKYDHLTKNMTKREMMETLGYYRIMDCGKLKLKWAVD